jgi:hypothetical protein
VRKIRRNWWGACFRNAVFMNVLYVKGRSIVIIHLYGIQLKSIAINFAIIRNPESPMFKILAVFTTTNIYIWIAITLALKNIYLLFIYLLTLQPYIK